MWGLTFKVGGNFLDGVMPFRLAQSAEDYVFNLGSNQTKG